MLVSVGKLAHKGGIGVVQDVKGAWRHDMYLDRGKDGRYDFNILTLRYREDQRRLLWSIIMSKLTLLDKFHSAPPCTATADSTWWGCMLDVIVIQGSFQFC